MELGQYVRVHEEGPSSALLDVLACVHCPPVMVSGGRLFRAECATAHEGSRICGIVSQYEWSSTGNVSRWDVWRT